MGVGGSGDWPRYWPRRHKRRHRIVRRGDALRRLHAPPPLESMHRRCQTRESPGRPRSVPSRGQVKGLCTARCTRLMRIVDVAESGLRITPSPLRSVASRASSPSRSASCRVGRGEICFSNTSYYSHPSRRHFPHGACSLLGVAAGAHSAAPPQPRNKVCVLCQQPNLRLRLLKPEPYVHLAVHRRRGRRCSCACWRSPVRR